MSDSMTADKHEELGMQALGTAELYRGYMHAPANVAIVGSYSSLALAHFTAAGIKRREEQARDGWEKLRRCAGPTAPEGENHG